MWLRNSFLLRTTGAKINAHTDTQGPLSRCPDRAGPLISCPFLSPILSASLPLCPLLHNLLPPLRHTHTHALAPLISSPILAFPSSAQGHKTKQPSLSLSLALCLSLSLSLSVYVCVCVSLCVWHARAHAWLGMCERPYSM